MNLTAPITVHAAERPRATALITQSLTLDYAALDAAIWRMAGYLASQGVRRGDRLGVVIDRCAVVLLVEDDADVQSSIIRILGTFGYKVHASFTGPDALRLIDDGLKPDLILADVVLPAGMSGPEVAEAVVERVPTCKTLFMSGYTDNYLIHEGRIDPGIVLLSKPFPRETVAARIRQILDAPAA